MDLQRRYDPKILETGILSDHFDIEISVGEEPNTKTFHLNSSILQHQSNYFYRALSTHWIKVENNNIKKFQKPNISVEVFDIIVKYIYSGKVCLTNDFKTNVDVLIAADELLLTDLCSRIEEELLKDKTTLKDNLVLTQYIASKLSHLEKLPQFYNDEFQKDPSLIFDANDFTTIEQTFLLDILTKNDHSLKPIKVWDKLVEWCCAQSVELQLDINDNNDNLLTFKDLIQPFIPYIDFKNICSEDFFQKIHPFKKIFDADFYIDILEDYSFNSKLKLVIASKIINSQQAFILADYIKIMNNDTHDIFYEFELLIRGSRDGFEENPFDARCEDEGPTITVARVKNTNEILGGFNSLKWKSYSNCICTKGNFIFSLDKNNLENSIFSEVDDENKAVRNGCDYFKPDFGDLCFLIDSTNKGIYYKKSYKRSIRQNEGEFEIDDYEVFKVHSKLKGYH